VPDKPVRRAIAARTEGANAATTITAGNNDTNAFAASATHPVDQLVLQHAFPDVPEDRAFRPVANLTGYLHDLVGPIARALHPTEASSPSTDPGCRIVRNCDRHGIRVSQNERDVANACLLVAARR
jgi:hypothetical protein